MSIINEALKKAQKDKAPFPPSAAARPGTRNLEVEIARKKTGMNWGPIFVLMVLTLITGPILAPLFSVPFRSSGSAAAPREIAAGRTVPRGESAQYAAAPSENRRGQFAIEEMPKMPLVTPLYQRPDLSLSGVMYSSPTDSYCIINEKVMRVGDSIGGARLTRVTPKEVLLEFQGEKIVLPVSDGF